MTKEDSPSEEEVKFRLVGKINLFFIILILLSAIPIGIGFIGIFDQFAQPVVLHTGMTDVYDLDETINLEANTLYYITVAPRDPVTAGIFTTNLRLFQGTEEVYYYNIQYTIKSGQKGIILSFDPFISDTEGSYTLDCTMTFPATFHPFYLKIQKAAGITQITGFSGREILEIGMVIFLIVIIGLIIVSLIARTKHTVRLGKFAGSSETSQQPSKFVWKSKDENEDS